jgi:hypothetical protein
VYLDVLANGRGVVVARTDNDSWEITGSVGATALGVAAARAAEPDLRPRMQGMAGYDRGPSQDIEDAAPQTLFVTAQRGRREVTR